MSIGGGGHCLLEPRPVTEPAERVWNDVAAGCGGDVSPEMEGLTVTVGAGVNTSIDALRQTISQ